MTDLWGFLLQTLTASGAAVLLLVVKAMFRDKLPPRWQFAAWGVLGLVLLPAGLGGRYALLNWPWLVETVKTIFSGDYSLTRVLAPIPLPRLRVPSTAAAEKYGLPTCPSVEVPGLTSAFICGVFWPVLALPAGEMVDDKVLLHGQRREEYPAPH